MTDRDQGQLDFFGQAGPAPKHAQGSGTSKQAAQSIRPSTESLRGQILKTIERYPQGLTCDAIEELLGMRHQTASARCKELRDMGAIVDSGKRRATRSGRSAMVLLAASDKESSGST